MNIGCDQNFDWSMAGQWSWGGFWGSNDDSWTYLEKKPGQIRTDTE